MATLVLILKIALAVVCVALVIVVLMQEGRSEGLGAIAGSSDSYWSKNKSRSAEGALVLITRILIALFVIISIVLNLKVLA